MTVSLGLLFCGASYGQDAGPVGQILAAGGASLQLPGVDTVLTAAPGMELRPGYKIRTGGGSLRFSFCPDLTEQTLLPGQELTIPQSHLSEASGKFGDVRKLPSCGLLAAKRGVTLVDEPKPAANTFGKTYALLVGISEYPHELPKGLGNLLFAHADAQSFAEFLQTPKGGALLPRQIKLLINGAATRAAIDSAVKTLEQQAAGRQNTLILFVAAHGHFLTANMDPETKKIVERDPYIVTADVYGQDVKTTGYPMAEFHNLIAKETSLFGRVIVYVDVCHAGYVRDAVNEQGLQPAVKRVFSDRKGGSVGVMMASEATKFAYEAEQFGGHGAFTYYVLDGLNGGAAHRNSKVITFADLFRYVVNGVGELTNNTQSPDKFVIDDQMSVLDDVTKNPGISLPPATPLPESATRRRRGSASTPPGQRSELAAQSAFEQLARSDPLAAVAEYTRVAAGPAVPEQDKRQRAETLRVALEDHGQQILIRYLHGEQIPQTKADFELGARYFEEALRLPQAPVFDESRMWFCRGRALIFDREESPYQEAVRLLERSILLDPDHAYAYNALGIAYLEQVRQHPEYYQRAIAAFHDALRFAPDWAYPMHNMALAYAEQGSFALAVATYRQAMRMAPAYSYLPYNLALLNQRMNRLSDAEELYRLAKGKAEDARKSGLLPPASPWRERADILNGLGSVAFAKHSYKTAQDDYEQALHDDPQLIAAKYNLAVLLSRKGPSDPAVKLWRENIVAAPAEPASRLALAEYLVKNGDRSGAIQEYEAAVRVAPNHAGAGETLAKLYAGEERWQSAYDQLLEARKQIPDHAAIAEEFADAAAKLGRLDEAAAAYRDAARLYPDKRDRKRLEAKLVGIGRI